MPAYFDTYADSLTGALMALEGIQDAVVILNGPTGCKSYQSGLSDNQYPRGWHGDMLAMMNTAFYGQPRIPCTCLGGDDYIFGATSKLEQVLDLVSSQNPSLIAVVNSPGASLIGDDLKRVIEANSLEIPMIVIENTGFSEGPSFGFRVAAQQVLQRVVTPYEKPSGPVVNLVGLSLMHRHWEGSLAELRRLLGLCSIQVQTAICAGSPVRELAGLRKAACNLVVFEDYGLPLAEWMKSEFDIPYVSPNHIPPVGFSATEEWITKIANYLSVDPTPALSEIRTARKHAYASLVRFNAYRKFPKGAVFGVEAPPSLAYGLTRWLYEYFAMIPIAIKVTEQDSSGSGQQLEQFLSDIHCHEAWGLDPREAPAEIIIADMNTIAEAQRQRPATVGIDIGVPGRGYLDILPKTLLGSQGALYLIEQILRGLEYLPY